MQIKEKFSYLKDSITNIEELKINGYVTSIRGMLIECKGISSYTSLGAKCKIISKGGREVLVEVVGYENEKTFLMPYGEIEGIGMGSRVVLIQKENVIYPHESWLGRIINAYGEPIDNKGPLIKGPVPYKLKSVSYAPKRNKVGSRISTGIRAIDTFLTCCHGQRMGIFAGSGVGKSMLISMLAKFSNNDVNVIGLIGERSREVQEFIDDYLGEEGLKKSVIIVSTGNESALMRKSATYLTMAVSEYFRDQKNEVLCIIDSLTRFAMAQREIGLSVGEPPSTKGYTPTVFSELPKLLERAGPGMGDTGNITGIFSVLVEGDDQNEPIADAVRGILDGHIILDRNIAERGRFPAVDILRSVSRTIPKCHSDYENQLIVYARKLLTIYNDMAEMIRIGAYKSGNNAEVDMAIKYYPQLESFLSQKHTEHTPLSTSFKLLANILNLSDFYENNSNNDQDQ